MHYWIGIYRACAGDRSVRIGIDRSEREMNAAVARRLPRAHARAREDHAGHSGRRGSRILCAIRISGKRVRFAPGTAYRAAADR